MQRRERFEAPLRFFICLLPLVIFSLLGCSISGGGVQEVVVEPWTEYSPKHDPSFVEELRNHRASGQELYEVYWDLPILDIHNHDAANVKAISRWEEYGIDRIVLFGSISEPRAKATDHLTWEHYQREPSRFYPSFAGFPIYEDEGIDIVRENLEKGYLNIGEVAAASTYSPVVANLEWKAQHPNDGNLPQIYELAGQYQVPILLHIDPPTGNPIIHFESAMVQNPDTSFIFAHANAYNSPGNIESLLEKHENLYIDFFAGFTAYNPDSIYTLEDFIPLMEQYPDRFMISTDSGFGISTAQAAKAIFETIDLLSAEAALKVAYQNYEALIERQPPTETQIQTIIELSEKAERFETYQLNKRMANELIFELMELTAGIEE
ncbi:amidohydrolase family protein [Bacillus horti]|uniref:TIM-barrel fold metal-dependent hydrolase n=1 Tax=Caldalkalibacillus horti TaxID=77523 RepID=A0ABT9VVE6_9BACI|nr:amidohydrolase [Bacillus horti]MDQ0164855.1 putative TIM-barrel fold metal-dependent hydrolase [Bacillus horti]